MKQATLFTASLVSLFAAGISQYVDPDTVPKSDRAAWCLNQIAACPLICTQETAGSAGTYANDCDPDNLVYNCVCSNGLSPNISEYSQTVPYYICEFSNNQCVANCGLSNNACASSCREDNPCGAQNPTKANETDGQTKTSPSTTTSGGADSTAVYNGFGSSATSSSGNGKSNAATSLVINVGQVYGLGVVAAGIFAGFSILL